MSSGRHLFPPILLAPQAAQSPSSPTRPGSVWGSPILLPAGSPQEPEECQSHTGEEGQPIAENPSVNSYFLC